MLVDGWNLAAEHSGIGCANLINDADFPGIAWKAKSRVRQIDETSMVHGFVLHRGPA
jgi:hypothetical protein